MSQDFGAQQMELNFMEPLDKKTMLTMKALDYDNY
jgi:hypothetical protein